ncbi:MAG: amidohydrolase family protein, partial [Gemmatimonadota bacterium]|nr:amidohydrolase family protein [Gemmatimonadota bacterium]
SKSINSGTSRLLEALDLLQKREVPLFIDFDQPYYNLKQLGQHEQRAIDLPAVRHLAEKFPGLPVVVVGANYNHTGKIFELFDRVENLKAELSLFQGFEVLAFICRTWGPERLLFGTGLPAISPGAARAAVMYADIGEDDRRKIASANLEALLGEPPAPALDEDPERSGLLQEIDRGRRIESIEVIDLHGHIAPVGFESVMGLTLGPQDAGSMVRVMDRIGIQAVAVSSWEVAGGNAPAGNRLAWEAVEKHPGRFLPYMVVNANFPEDWPAESAECFDRKRFFGLKPYPFFQRCPLSGPAYKKSLCLADRLGLPVLCHPGFDPLSGLSPGELEVLAPRYPGAIFLVAHAGASFRLADAFCDLALAFDNVLLEINYTSVPFGMISYLTGKVGAGRVIFGTDMPMRDPAPIIGWVAYDHLTDEERRSILGLNARALIEKTGYPGPVGRP